MIRKLVAESMKMSEKSVRWFMNWSEWNPTKAEFRRAISFVQLEEKERLGKFVFRKDARASLVGRLMMRKFINEYCQLPYEKIVLARNDYGKPILANPITPRFANFNVSHQGNLTVLAAEMTDVNLGVDVMKLEYTGGKELKEFFRLMTRNFSANEWMEIRGNPEQSEIEQTLMFCRHWALKESYSKALGVGITMDLRELDFRTKTKLSINEYIDDTTLWIKGIKQNWIFHETLLDRDHCVSVALPMANERYNDSAIVKFEKLDFNQLVCNAVPLYPEDFQYAENYFAKEEKPCRSKNT